MKDLIIIGAGPIGLACGIEAKKNNLDYEIIDKGMLVNSIFNYPVNTTFFSTADKLEIGEIPFISHNVKPTRTEALEYYRRVCDSWKLNLSLYNEVSEILNKKAAVVSFLDGSSKKNLSPENCFAVGVETAKMHMITKKLSIKRENRLSVQSWRAIYDNVKKDCSKIHINLPNIVEKNLDEIENNWPQNIPSGIIHADLFPDNIFFNENKLSGIIDFYFVWLWII